MSLRGDQTRFFAKLSAMMEAAVPLLKAFEVAAGGVTNPGFRAALERILSRAYGGNSLTESIATEGSIFSPEVMCLLRHGEETGDLEMKSAAIARGLRDGTFEEGQLSAHSVTWLGPAFGVTINHARLMTLTDLSALLRLQLEHFGFLPLWDLLDAALAEQVDALTVTTPAGQRYQWRDAVVHVDFQTFDHWANEGSGANLPAGRLALADGGHRGMGPRREPALPRPEGGHFRRRPSRPADRLVAGTHRAGFREPIHHDVYRPVRHLRRGSGDRTRSG